ncbi:hypothetical protein PR202_ga22460 [Eleusine coracana subsp. coracana]|uniref:Cyclic nucleotide-binding domain-containing protein n=1 Tax=Eleusine coracana subsp. coracana TaxID=191504 RepID=A0AAV5D366_ELECO|nr:hypothetical protein PR202_ga22460 [Eleusine coracana subsp. coracana]
MAVFWRRCWASMASSLDSMVDKQSSLALTACKSFVRRLEMQLRRRDVEKWMSHRRLPEDLRRSDILYQGGTVEKMVFIVRGKLESISADGSKSQLHEGDVCGEELLTWYLEHSSVNKDMLPLPCSDDTRIYLLEHPMDCGGGTLTGWMVLAGGDKANVSECLPADAGSVAADGSASSSCGGRRTVVGLPKLSTVHVCR